MPGAFAEDTAGDRLLVRMAGGSLMAHAVVVGLMMMGVFDSGAETPETPSLAQVTMITEAEFQAALAAAPNPGDVAEGIANAGTPEGADTAATETAPAPSERPRETAEPETAEAPQAPEPEPEPETAEAPDIAPPATPIPSEPVRPTIAEVASPDILPRQAAVPESPPATEPVQPLAAGPLAAPDAAPTAPTRPEPEPEPAPVETAEAEPEPTPEPEPAAETQPETQPEPEPEVTEAAGDSLAPQTAALPAARPARLAAAAPASGPAPERTAEPETAVSSAERDALDRLIAEAQAGETRRGDAPAPAATAPTFARQMTRGEVEALSIGIRDYFSYGGRRDDRALAVKVSFRLTRAGAVEPGSIERVGASGQPAAARDALFQSARRAIVRAGSAGVFARLPAQKYDAWRWIHATFTPETNARGVDFSS
ncbi:MAG: hypothetical protein AAFV86_08975 [Pseudomonadota bacterium]